MCKPNIEARAQNPIVLGKPSVHSAMQDVLGRELRPVAANTPQNTPRRDSTGRVAIVGSCYACRELNYKQRKTRKACVDCHKPVCDEHSTAITKCKNCYEVTGNN